MFTARIVVLIVALGAGGVAASPASGIDRDPSASAGITAAFVGARPAMAVERTIAIKPAPAATASMLFAHRVTAQK